MSIGEVLREARSVRKFDNSKRIDISVLRDTVEDLRYTPSTANIQPLKFYLAADEEKCRVIRANTAWARMLPGYDGPSPDEDPSAYIVICHDLDIAPEPERFLRDVGICAQTINLLMRERGIGCCMIGSFDKSRAISDLSLPSNIVPMLICALGYPAEYPAVDDARDGNVRYWRDGDGAQVPPCR